MFPNHKRFKIMLIAGIMFLMLQVPLLMGGMTEAANVAAVQGKTSQNEMSTAIFSNDLIASSLQAEGYNAVEVSESHITNGGLNNYDMLILSDIDSSIATNIQSSVETFVRNGGTLLTVWNASTVLFSSVGSTPNGVLLPQWNWYDGEVDHGGLVAKDTPIDIIDTGHPLTLNLDNPFSAGDGTHFFFTVSEYPADLEVVAQYDGHDGTWPALMTGSYGGGKVIIVLFDAQDNPNDQNIKQMFMNSINYAGKVNHAPTLDNSGDPELSAIEEDDSNNDGTLVSTLISRLGGNGISDSNNSALEGIAVTAVDNSNGTWQFDPAGGTSWTTFASLSDNSATLLASTAKIRFVPNTNFYGTLDSAITFRAWDQTNGSNGDTGVDVSTHGGTTAFSTATETASITLTPVADTPSITNARTSQNTPTRDGLVITPHPDDGDSVTHFQITNITGGTLYRDDGKVEIYNQDLIPLNAGLHGLTFKPEPMSHSNGTFNIQASLTDRNSGRGGGVITATIAMLKGIYIHSGVNPTDTTTINMDEVFGAGNWQNDNYDTLDMSAVFAPSTDFIFIEGGQSDASEMQAFLTNNGATIEEWVSGGGCLLLNASPTEGDGLEFGFGASLSRAQSNSGTAAEANHPIFNEPDVPGTSFAGAGLSEGIISDKNLTPLILNSQQQPILGEKVSPGGRVAFGALNFSLFDSLEQPQHNNLHRNIIHYIANCGSNYPPVANNLTISPVITKADGSTVVPTAGMTMTVTYDYFDANGDTKQSPRVRWRRKYKLEEQEEPGLNDKEYVPAGATTAEEYWCVTLRPNDGRDYGRAKETCVAIERVPNPLPEVKVTLSESPTGGLKLDYEFIDDGPEDEDKRQVRWYRNGQLQPAFNNQNEIAPSETEVGEEWCVTVRGHDGIEYGGVSEKQCTIINPSEQTLPFIAYPRINPPEPKSNQDLRLVYDYEDPDGITRGQQNVEVRWFRDGQLQPQLNDKMSVSDEFVSPGETWWATVRPLFYTTRGYRRVIITDPVYVSAETINSAPQVTNLIINPQRPTIKDNLRLTYDFIDVDNDSQGETIIEWHKNSRRVHAYDGLRVIPAQAIDEGEVWHAFVIPHDGRDYGQRMAAHSVKIASTPSNSRPEAREVYLSPRRPDDSDNLELNYTFHDDNGDSEGDTKIEWFVDGVSVPRYEGRDFIRDQVTHVGEEWCAKITPHDGTVFGNPTDRSCVTILKEGSNTPPTVANVHISPAIPRSSEDLRVNYEYFDADGNPENDSQIRWYVNGRLNSDFENLTVIPAEHTSPDQSWQAEVQTGDGSTQYSAPLFSEEVIINSPPTVTNARIALSNELTLMYEYDDKDNHPEGTPQIQWRKDGVHQEHLDHQRVVPSTELAANQTWSATIATFDEFEYSQPYTTTKLTIMRLFLPLILRQEPIVIDPTPTPIPTPPTPTPTPDPDENNDTQETAYGPLEFGQDYHGYPEDLDDWYYVVLDETSSLEVILSKYDEDIGLGGQLLLYEDTGDRQTRNGLFRQYIASDGGREPTRKLPTTGHPDALTDLAPGKYLIRVHTKERHNDDNQYRLNVNKIIDNR